MIDTMLSTVTIVNLTLIVLTSLLIHDSVMYNRFYIMDEIIKHKPQLKFKFEHNPYLVKIIAWGIILSAGILWPITIPYLLITKDDNNDNIF